MVGWFWEVLLHVQSCLSFLFIAHVHVLRTSQWLRMVLVPPGQVPKEHVCNSDAYFATCTKTSIIILHIWSIYLYKHRISNGVEYIRVHKAVLSELDILWLLKVETSIWLLLVNGNECISSRLFRKEMCSSWNAHQVECISDNTHQGACDSGSPTTYTYATRWHSEYGNN